MIATERGRGEPQLALWQSPSQVNSYALLVDKT